MKVAHLTSVHFPFDTRIFARECASLSSAGYGVCLIAPAAEEQSVDSIKVKPIARFKPGLRRMLLAGFQLYRAALRENAALYHFHDPELIPLGLLLKLHGKRVLYDVHEDMPKLLLDKYWIPKWLRKPAAGLTAMIEALAARLLDGIVAATPPIAARFRSPNTVTVQNFPRIEEFSDCPPQPYDQRENIVAYVGVITAHRGARELVAAMGSLPPELKARLVLAGEIRPARLHDELARSQVAQLLSKARIGLVTLHPLPNYVESYPVKLFEYMAAGLPVIASDFPLWRKIVKEANCGILVDPTDPCAIAEAIQWLLEHPGPARAMGECGARAVQAKYNWMTEERKLLDLYARLTA